MFENPRPDLKEEEAQMEKKRLKVLAIRMAVMREERLYLNVPSVKEAIEDRIRQHLSGKPIKLTDEDQQNAKDFLLYVHNKAMSRNPLDHVSSFLLRLQIDHQVRLLKEPPNTPIQGNI